MLLRSLLRPELVFLRLPCEDREQFLASIAERLADATGICDAAVLTAKLAEREALDSTAVGGGVAIPHCKLEGIDEPVVAIAVAKSPGVRFGGKDDARVRVFCVLVSPESSPAAHLKALAAVCHKLQDEPLVEALAAAKKGDTVIHLLTEREAEHPESSHTR